ncbi:MAG TPA: glycosyl hydrolase family 79 C-terminal domain-containing protein [Verrucomicrobiae bacterium]|jgi:hypothetical protein
MKYLLLLFAVTLIGSGVTLFAQNKIAAVAVHIQVEPDVVLAPIADDFMGLGYETSAVARNGYFSPKNAHLVQLYRTLSAHGLVRIGGNISDHARYVPEGVPAARSERETTVINQATLTDLGEFLRATGWKAMWGLNLGTGTKAEAVQEALAVQAALGDRLQSFEIGNEVDLLPRSKHAYTNYFAAYQEYKAAIRQALPTAVFSGPDVASATRWTEYFSRTEAEDMKLLTHHYYRSGAMKPDATIETLLAPDPQWESTLRVLEQTCADHQIAFRINEVNSFYGGGKAGVSDTFASALWCLDYMFRIATHQGGGVNLETDVNQLAFVSHYSPIFRDANDQLTARPEYYGMLAFAISGHGQLVKLAVSKSDLNLTAYATKNGSGDIWVTVINKDLTRPATLEIAMPENYSVASAYRLTAPSAESKNLVTLAGKEISENGSWTPEVTEPVPVKAGWAGLQLPATSAVLVHLR